MSRITLTALMFLLTYVSATAGDIKLLFLGDQKHHQPATRFKWIQPVMAEKGIHLTYTEDIALLNKATLDQYDGLILYANIDAIAPDQSQALLEFVASGKGFVPIHCASFCFRNAPEMVALIGAQFQRHGKGDMTTQSANVDHPIMDGYQRFTSWDETYVHHLHNDENRTVLEYRVGGAQADGNTREPWTWIRTHGKGRVFYTAWGHDQRTWHQSGFHELLQRGILWACGSDASRLVAADTSNASVTTSLNLPSTKTLPGDLKPFEYVDVGPQIPNYNADRTKGRQGEDIRLMQQPVSADESMKHIATPEGFHVELFADESMLNGNMFAGKPIAMNWDASGRLWICETVDYPNELKDSGRGRDRVRVLSDTTGDGKADTSVVFAEDLSIPTAIAFHRGGVVVQNGVETLYLKDTDGDGKADQRKVLISNWALGDTHGGVSNFRNGLDNWIWAMQGYNSSSPVINGKTHPAFRMGFFRFKLSQDNEPVVEKFEFIRSTTNNTWGLGISEEGLIFGSTANRQPSFFMPIANRYYERVRGWAPERLSMISPTHLFEPITDKVRQVDHHGGYTAAAGHALYTARNYPPEWWNRTAFVCGPTGKLVGTFVIQRDGAGMKSQSPINLFASDDEWTAPIMAEVGPDGNVWVLDWYNYIVQHNPTPQGFETGKGQAYETKLRDKKYGRIYRVVPDSPQRISQPLPHDVQADALVKALSSPTMQVRLHAQRLLIEGNHQDSIPSLVRMLADPSIDKAGLNVSVIHALNALVGLGAVKNDSPRVIQAIAQSLSHPSAGVRVNAVRVLPNTRPTFELIRDANLLADKDSQVVLAALLKLSDIDEIAAGSLLSQAADDSRILNDRWLRDALTSASAIHAESFLVAMLANQTKTSEELTGVIERTSEHFARRRPSPDAVANLVKALSVKALSVKALSNEQYVQVDAVIAGLSRGWPETHTIASPKLEDSLLREVFRVASDSGKASLARLANAWSNDSLEQEIKPIVAALISNINDPELTIEKRVAAATELISLDPGREETADAIAGNIGPHSPVSLSIAMTEALSSTQAPGLSSRFLDINKTATPGLRSALVRVMLSRPELTASLMSALESGELQISDLSIQQRRRLTSNPDIEIRRSSRDLFAKGGLTLNSDRAELVTAKMPLTKMTGDPVLGKTVYTKNCAACHRFKGEGNTVGPNLNGMSFHPKGELLVHILDPNRSVEANYRLYNVLTADGVVISGLLSSESLTSIEMVDTRGIRHTILREDIEELKPSKNSAMPEGFEQSIDDAGLTNLLEYLTQGEDFIALGLEEVANVVTTEGMFTNRDNQYERLVLPSWGTQVFEEIPFSLIDPKGRATKNAVMLHGPLGSFAPKLERSVQIRCKMPAAKIHLLGGVAGWASKQPHNGGVSMVVRLKYADGQTEDHPLIDGQHIADYIGQFNVPQSRLAFKAQDGGQIRYLSITPKREAMIDVIELVKPDHRTAPLVMAITVELPGQHDDN